MSFGILGILVTLDISFLVNFILIKTLREYTDAYVATLPQEKDFGQQADVGDGAISKFVETYFIGLLFGKVKNIPLSTQRFPGWEPISFKAGLITTTVFALVSLLLLSPEYFSDFIGADMGSLMVSGELCNRDDQDAGIERLRQQVESFTNFEIAVAQHGHMVRFNEALIHDTTLYGEPGFACPTEPNGLSGVKSDWQDFTRPPAAEHGPFFPGYCEAAKEAAISAALRTTCTVEQCACPVVPRNGFTEFFGIDGDELCFLRVCASSAQACPGHTNDARVNLRNYREGQLNELDNPPEPEIDQPEADLQAELSQEAQDAAVNAATRLLEQADLAGNIYSIYSVVALYFPTPLLVFRLPYIIAIKRFFFGAEQKRFIILFVSTWWAIRYINGLFESEEVQIFLSNLMSGDPCFLDPAYVARRFQTIEDICDELVPLQPEFDTNRISVRQVIFEVDFFAQCDCLFPMEAMFDLRSTEFPESEVGELGFSVASADVFCERRNGGCTVLLPEEDIEFLGNRTICLDSEFARDIAVQAPDSRLNRQQVAELYISSGLIASFVVKIAMTNFILALMKYADPFIGCYGKFLWVPARLGSGLGGRDKNEVFRGFKLNAERTLRNISLKGVIIWGIVFHACLFNLFSSALMSSEARGGLSFSEEDRNVYTFALVTSSIVITIGLSFRAFLKWRIRSFSRGKEQEENDEQERAESSRGSDDESDFADEE